MPQSLTLNNGPMRCELLPELGGCVVGLWHGETALLRYTPAEKLQSARQAASYPLVPYSNRIGNSVFSWSGQEYHLPPNNLPEPHVIHGVGFERAWTVTQSDNMQAVMAYQHTADAHWPFAFDAEQRFTLLPDGLQMDLQITQREPVPAPVGLGWHPFFAKRPQSRIRFQATGRWEMGDDKLPTHCAPGQGLEADCASLTVDHCFEGWNGAVLLQDDLHTLRITSGLDRLVVFTNPQRDNIAIEPVSHVNNALGMAQAAQSPVPGHAPWQSMGLRVLHPGEVFRATLHIHVQPTV